jgi:AraC-like DNA-binding protein
MLVACNGIGAPEIEPGGLALSVGRSTLAGMAETAQTYAEVAPPVRLAADVRCVWWSSFGGSVPILPDGALDLIVAGDKVFVAGPDTRATYSEIATGVVIHGIRFRPGRAGRVLGVPPEALRDRRVDIQDLWGVAGRITVERLIEDPRRLATVVTERLRSASDADPAVDFAVRRIWRDHARFVDVLEEVGVSERQLRRRFTALVGYGPATFLRVARLQRARHLALKRPGSALADLAYDAGYADQAHLSREVRLLSGVTARALLRPSSRDDSEGPPPPGDGRSVQDRPGARAIAFPA